MTANFDHIFNWRLLAGSHDFPGPDGGTCINEAAVIAAGFEYRRVERAADCPLCFSRPLAQYLIGVNDLLPDSERQKLLPFVLRLSGSADSADVERRRADLIVLRAVQRVLPIALRAAGLDGHARSCAEVRTYDECRAAVDAAAAAAAAAARAAAAAAARAADAADAAATARAAAAADAAEIYAACIDIAEEAFAIGNQAAPSDIAAVTARLDAARRPALVVAG